MKKMIAGLILGAGCLMAAPRIGFSIGIGVPAPVAVYPAVPAPAPVVVAVPPCPGPRYTWVGGSWYYAGGRRLWRGGYWAPPAHVAHFDRHFRR